MGFGFEWTTGNKAPKVQGFQKNHLESQGLAHPHDTTGHESRFVAHVADLVEHPGFSPPHYLQPLTSALSTSRILLAVTFPPLSPPILITSQ